MIDCLVLGDSIAVGIGNELQHCLVVAGVGRRAGQAALINYPPARRAIISIGSNDMHGDVGEALARLRAGISAECVIWILPMAAQRAPVTVEAMRRGDNIVDLRRLARGDGVHPLSYRALAREIRRDPCMEDLR